MNSLRIRKTGKSALSETIAIETPKQLEEVRLHLSGNGASENLIIKLDSKEGPEYDVVFLTQSVNGIADYVYQPTRPKEFEAGDSLVISLANSTSLTWGLEVIMKAI